MTEFKKWSDKFHGRGMKFKYDDLHSVHLAWDMYVGRRISLRHILSKTVRDYCKEDFSDVPLPILKASIKFFQDQDKKRQFHDYYYEKVKSKTNSNS